MVGLVLVLGFVVSARALAVPRKSTAIAVPSAKAGTLSIVVKSFGESLKTWTRSRQARAAMCLASMNAKQKQYYRSEGTVITGVAIS